MVNRCHVGPDLTEEKECAAPRVGGGEFQTQEEPAGWSDSKSELGTHVCLGSGGGIVEGQGPAHAEPLSLGKDCGLHSKGKRKLARRFLKEKKEASCVHGAGRRFVGLGHFERKTNRQSMLLDQRWEGEGGRCRRWLPVFSFGIITKVRQIGGGTGLGMLNFRCLGLLKGQYSEVTQPSDVMKSNANKRNNSPNCFGIS